MLSIYNRGLYKQFLKICKQKSICRIRYWKRSKI